MTKTDEVQNGPSKGAPVKEEPTLGSMGIKIISISPTTAQIGRIALYRRVCYQLPVSVRPRRDEQVVQYSSHRILQADQLVPDYFG
jgi:hypothetical protein